VKYIVIIGKKSLTSFFSFLFFSRIACVFLSAGYGACVTLSAVFSRRHCFQALSFGSKAVSTLVLFSREHYSTKKVWIIRMESFQTGRFSCWVENDWRVCNWYKFFAFFVPVFAQKNVRVSQQYVVFISFDEYPHPLVRLQNDSSYDVSLVSL